MSSLMQKKCGCKRHADFDEEGVSGNLLKISNKKIKSSVLSELRRLGAITHKTNYVCTSCVKHIENGLEKKVDNFDDILLKISSNQFNESELVQIASALGESQRGMVKKDALQLSSEYRFLDKIDTYDPKTYLSARNAVLVTFILSVAGPEFRRLQRKSVVIDNHGDRLHLFCNTSKMHYHLIIYYVSHVLCNDRK